MDSALDVTSLDAPPADPLEGAFVLPSYLAEEPRYATLYATMTARLRQEAKGLPMTTIQTLLLERIATFYVLIRYREDTETWAGVNQQKEFNAYWLSLSAEFSKLLAQGEDKRREALVNEIETMVLRAMEVITIKEDRQAVRKLLSEGFARLEV